MTYKNGSCDYLRITSVEYVGKTESYKSPYFDMGGEGLELVRITRERIYARSSNWRPSYVTTIFLVGKMKQAHTLVIQWVQAVEL